MKDLIQDLVFSFRLVLELLGIFLRDITKYFFPTSPKSPKKDVILVIGGSKGAGRKLLRELAQEDNDLTLISWDVDEEANKDVVKELRDLGAKRVMAYNVDVTDRDQVTKTAAEVRRSYGDVTMLFNYAGIAAHARASCQIDINHFVKALDLNLDSHINSAEEFLPAMLGKNRDRIIGTRSILSFAKSVHGLRYFISKHGLGAFYECLKADYCSIAKKSFTFLQHEESVGRSWRTPI